MQAILGSNFDYTIFVIELWFVCKLTSVVCVVVLVVISSLVRRASANVVSIIAKYAVPAGEWTDLLPFLFQCSQSAQEEHREVFR